ncbi:hypothetical protein [Halosolutus gelatinilyticus]|uniref:hypothetical protein n=1 Tax=Halosolutus gelatinilyticus TaxID=2931975 RepID=UPI001FF585EE|nr:hypothetical protein [Halosolutus gelatinilyticus]
MNRRTFLAGTAGVGLLPGCSAVSLPGGDADRSPFGVDSPDDSNDGDEPDFPGIDDDPTVVDFETAPLTAVVASGPFVNRFGLSIDFVEPATPDSPARLAAVLENGRSYDRTIETRRLPLFDDPPSARNDEREWIYLAPTAETDVAETLPDYHRDEEGRWRVEDVEGDWFPETITLGPDERLTAEFVLLGHHDRGESAIGPGRYRFASGDGAFTIAVWPTGEPGPDGESRFAEAMPGLPDAEQTAWYHEATPETEVSLRPSTEAVDAPGRIGFELINHGRTTMAGNPYYWRLYKLVEDEWYPIHPWMWTLPLSHLRPGDRDETTLHVFHGESVPCEDARVVDHLGGGRYAYAVGYRRDGETHAAAFDFEAPGLAISPEADAEVDDRGETVAVRLPNYDDARRPATITVTRSDADPDAVDDRLLPEQLPRQPFRGFRNAFPLFEDGVTTVRVKTDRWTALQPFDDESGNRRTILYDGRVFDATGAIEDE